MPEGIPAFSLARQNAALGADIRAAVERVLASGRYVQGAECAAFESEVAASALGGPPTQAVTCSSGTDALHMALRAVGVGPGQVVLTTAFSFFATAGAILLAGARPEFVDIEAESFNLDPAALARALQRPRAEAIGAILPVHLYGRVANMPAILQLAEARGIPVVEDAAQALGSSWQQRPAGTWSAAAAFSFYPTKNLGALGEGGMVSSRSAEVLERLRLLRVHGSRHRYEHETMGWNGRMHEMQAAILRTKLPHLANWIRLRRGLAAQYEQGLRGLAGVSTPECTAGHGFHQYVVRVRDRDAVRARLQSQGIGTEVYYPSPLHRQPALAAFPPAEPLPETERACREVLALPMYPELTAPEVERVCAALRGCAG
ncbi:MAG: DegT/DnrJ/EryC1/StrS family aminotransferase [Terriglobales bacterium]